MDRVHFTDIPPTKSSRPLTASRQSHLSAVRIYKFVDNSGVIHFSDAPHDNRFRLVYEGSLFDGEAARTRGLGLHRRHGEYRDLIQEAANRYQLDAALLHAVIHTESAYNPYAVSPKGATGLMQLMAGTAKRYGVKDRTDPRDNIEGGARYLRDLLVLFKNDKRLALAGYNAGENAVIRHGNNIPPYRETRHYVDRVLSLYDIYRSVY
jgi:soluble lytic murein transglycosylase-like protein